MGYTTYFIRSQKCPKGLRWESSASVHEDTSRTFWIPAAKQCFQVSHINQAAACTEGCRRQCGRDWIKPSNVRSRCAQWTAKICILKLQITQAVMNSVKQSSHEWNSHTKASTNLTLPILKYGFSRQQTETSHCHIPRLITCFERKLKNIKWFANSTTQDFFFDTCGRNQNYLQKQMPQSQN